MCSLLRRDSMGGIMMNPSELGEKEEREGNVNASPYLDI